MRRRGLALTIGAAAILAGLGLAALSKAQPPAAKAAPADRAELRAQVAKLRGEVELMKLEYDAIRPNILDFLGRAWQAEFVGENELAPPKVIVELKITAMTAGADYKGPDPLHDDPLLFAKDDELKAGDKKLAMVLRATVERKKEEFSRMATALNVKRMELAEAERQYNESR